jgi:hypothetical protein
MLDQALFTSVRGSRLEGYQLAARSAGIDEAEARELSRWSPAHDALLDPRDDAVSVNFHRLESGRYCASRTIKAGAEYSERQGPRIATNLLVCDEIVFHRFAFNPFRLLDAALAAGSLSELPPDSDTLPALSLAGGASAVEAIHVSQMSIELGPRPLALLVEAALGSPFLALAAPLPIDHLVRGLFSLLPLHARPELSFTTGLRYCASRPFRLQPLPPDSAEQRLLLKQSGAKVFDLATTANVEPKQEWAALVERALNQRKLHWLSGQVAEQHPSPV